MVNILGWQEIQQDYKDALLLGNGSSIAIDRRFGYGSLFDVANKEGFFDRRVTGVFKYLNTTDFELVMTMLRHTYRVNKALEITDEITRPVYMDVRDSLIQAVRLVHLEHREVEDRLPKIAEFMGGFKTILSLNYDLIVYWAMLCENDSGVTFKDCFNDGEFRYDWNEFRTPINGERKVALVFYPHGNLVLANRPNGSEEKIARAGDYESLLDTIVEAWTRSQRVPLFVSEGLNEQKVAAISRSGYLSTVVNSVCRQIGKSLTVYGCSLADNDEHIIEALSHSKVERIAVSVWTQAPNYEDDCETIRRKLQRVFQGRRMELKFFDSSSEGCWIN